MTKLIPITIFSVVMAMMSHRCSEYDYINYKYVRRERAYYIIMSIAMILFVGLRQHYNDTFLYVAIYKDTPDDIGLMEGIDWSKLGENPGFVFTNRLLRRLGFSVNSYLILFAIFSVGVPLWFIWKYSSDYTLSVWIFICFAGFIFTMAAMKQCMAMALCMLATHCVIKRKYIPFVLLILIAMTFHPYALMYFVTPFLLFRPWSSKTFIMLILAIFVGFSLKSIMGALLDMTTALGENYDESYLTGEGVNPMRLVVTSVPVLLSMVASKQIAETGDKPQYLIVNLSMLNAELMFVALFGDPNYFGRLANYFLPFQAVSIPWLITHFNPSSKRAMTIITAFCFGVYYVYSQAFHESFDAFYHGITLWDYIISLFTGGK